MLLRSEISRIRPAEISSYLLPLPTCARQALWRFKSRPYRTCRRLAPYNRLSPSHDDLIMPANLISGTRLSQELRINIARRAAALTARNCQPGLAVILVGDDPASAVYVRNKVKACADTAITSVLERYPAAMTQTELLARIAALNADPAIHGILVQMPLPRHIDPTTVIAAIATHKDVDGYSVMSAGELLAGVAGFRPCTPYGCMKLIETTGVDLKGKHAVVIGRSNTVGKPMALLLLQANATVTICHSGTADLGMHTRQADVVVVAVGRRNTLTAGMVKAGAIIIDVGMNRDDAGKLCGDVDFDAVCAVAGAITPVPGGVGPMTITMLLSNTIDAAEAAQRTTPQ